MDDRIAFGRSTLGVGYNLVAPKLHSRLIIFILSSLSCKDQCAGHFCRSLIVPPLGVARMELSHVIACLVTFLPWSSFHTRASSLPYHTLTHTHTMLLLLHMRDTICNCYFIHELLCSLRKRVMYMVFDAVFMPPLSFFRRLFDPQNRAEPILIFWSASVSNAQGC